jgi:hypothetical protein
MLAGYYAQLRFNAQASAGVHSLIDDQWIIDHCVINTDTRVSVVKE